MGITSSAGEAGIPSAPQPPARIDSQASSPRAKRLGALLFLVAVIPVVFIASIIHQYGVNVPFADEWSNLILVDKWDASQLTFADLIRAHNGHRIFFPRLIYLAFANLGHGNMRAEMFFSLFLCGVTSLGFLHLLRRTVAASGPALFALWALINLFLFSPIQAENWLWGFQLQIFLSNLCLVGAIIGVTAKHDFFLRFAMAFVFALVGTFSFGNGLLIWPVVAFVLVCRREKALHVVAWVGVALLVLCGYFLRYHNEALARQAMHWWEYPLFFFAFLGAPLARIPTDNPLVLPVSIGAVLATLYISAAVLCLRRGRAQPWAVWLAPGAYALGSALLAMVARIHVGVRHALDSRYTTVGTLLLVSVIGLAASLFFERSSAKKKIIGVGMVGVVLLLYALNLNFEFRYLALHRAFRSHGKAALQFSKVLDTDATLRSTLLLPEDQPTVARYLSILDRRGLTFPARRETGTMTDAENRSRRSTEEYGVFENLKVERPNKVIASGWSYLPASARPAAAIILAAGHNETWSAFALTDQREDRADVGARVNDSGRNLGWRGTVSFDRVPAEGTEISAWALNADTGQTYRLPGSFVITK